MVGGDCGNRFTRVAHVVTRKDRLVTRDEAVRELSWHVIRRDDRRHTIDGECR